MSVHLLNQPDDCQLADSLRSLLNKTETLKFDALVAFAVSSGIQELHQELETFLGRGGSVRIVVGVSNRVTTVEALKLLLDLGRKGAKVFVFHNDHSANPIFHPKLYLFQGKSGAVLIVGSNNMTGKGLVSNYEISLMVEPDFEKQEAAEFVASVEKIIEKYCDIRGGLAHALDEKFLGELQAEEYLGSEQDEASKPETSGESELAATAVAPRKKLFASKAVPHGRKAAASKAIVPPGRSAVAAAPVAARAPATPGRRGPIVWKKRLAPSDVQSQTGHPTGVVRLTQAKWRVGNKLIDWTTYFRKNLFGGFNWRTAKQKPFVEETEIKFDISILGVNIGVQTLKISDKPSGQAGQSNYTSSLHWGSLGYSIRKAKLTGRTLRLYGPPAASTEPFFIEIS